MKGIVFVIRSHHFAAKSQALEDPYLLWPFAACAIAGFLSAGFFWFQFRNLDRQTESEPS
jgi:hypothetical protein